MGFFAFSVCYLLLLSLVYANQRVISQTPSLFECENGGQVYCCQAVSSEDGPHCSGEHSNNFLWFKLSQEDKLEKVKSPDECSRERANQPLACCITKVCRNLRQKSTSILGLTRNRLDITTVGICPILLRQRSAVGVVVIGISAVVIIIPYCNVAGSTVASSFTERVIRNMFA